MEFNFLPKLPKSNLDDRTFKDLVDECLLRIPRYCPEWTNYNPSDPGITLIELFAWLGDQMLLRFNQVPRRHYVAFLELLGIRLQPPTAAKTEVTFYLSASLPEAYTIPGNTEVATPRSETEEAIIFSTDCELVIDVPQIQHLLSAAMLETQPQLLQDRLSHFWDAQPNGEWTGPELALFETPPEPGNCFYLVFDGERVLDGNVLVITLKGQAATGTGINPLSPPRRWEAWNGRVWQSVLLSESDDRTDGFSFMQLTQQGGDPLQGTEVILHMPQYWPASQFASYQGRWLRCTYTLPSVEQPGYLQSPRIVGLMVRTIGGTVNVSQSTLIRQEILGSSDGTPGQSFQLQGTPLLPRRDDEYLLVIPPGELPQRWQEVNDFAQSEPTDKHYTLDSLTGTGQFGPLIREPAQLQATTQQRSRLQRGIALPLEERQEAILSRQSMERQYGAVPPRGALIQMVAYRTGGGQRGNVQRGAIKIIKSAVPYVASVINHQSAYNGTDAESLEDAVIRVPRLLRTRDRAVTAEDFETLATEAGQGAIARVRCLLPQYEHQLESEPLLTGSETLLQEIERAETAQQPLSPLLHDRLKTYLKQAGTPSETAGSVRLLLVPQANLQAIAQGNGIHPDSFTLTPQLRQQVKTYLDERRLLGIEVRYEQPNYVGVAVQSEVALEPDYNHPLAQQALLDQIEITLYRFLNPITGGIEGRGWPFGRPVYESDIIQLLQKIVGVRYLGTVQLFELRQTEVGTWQRFLPPEPMIDPGPLGLICSWRDEQLFSGHVIRFL